jgi:cellulose synthase/poly-beta-1,6-N-acetylglucosamine synthase-like glycosyltransferase
MWLVEVLFWLAAGAVVYAYFGYAACLAVLAKIRPRPARTGEALPPLTIVVPAHDEAAWIAAKVENSLSLDYPADRLEIIVVSDGSSDDTVAMAEQFGARGVRTLVQPERRGKEAAMQLAARHARGEILLFTDANAMLNAGAARAVVRWFADAEVGCVAGEKRLVAPGAGLAGHGEGAYWRYESALKRLDSLVGSTMGATGELLVIRAADMVARETDNIIEDFALSMRLVEAGRRIVYEPDAVAVEEAPSTPGNVFERRARIAAGGYQAMWRLRSLLNPARGIVWWQYVSHRVVRWGLVPFLLPFVLAANLVLAPLRPIYGGLLALQLAFYASALAGQLLHGRPSARTPLVSLPNFFVAANLAALVGCLRLVTGRQTVLWQRTRP